MTTPLGSTRADSVADASQAIAAYMESDPNASLAHVTVMHMSAESGIGVGTPMSPADF